MFYYLNQIALLLTKVSRALWFAIRLSGTSIKIFRHIRYNDYESTEVYGKDTVAAHSRLCIPNRKFKLILLSLLDTQTCQSLLYLVCRQTF